MSNKTKFLEHNMNIIDIILRYFALMIIVILGGSLGSYYRQQKLKELL